MKPADYPRWWKYIVSYEDLAPGVVGVGGRGRRTVRGRLPYTLTYRTVVTQFDPPTELAYDAEGDLSGKGRMVVRPTSDGNAEVTWYWDVRTQGLWMNLLAPLLKGLFAWNHNAVMREGERGLRRWLAQADRA
jgi:hypothetical protein